MIIVNKDKDVIINTNNIAGIAMSDCKTEISSFGYGQRVILGTYEDKEVTKTVFNQIIEAMENNDKIFYMPE